MLLPLHGTKCFLIVENFDFCLSLNEYMRWNGSATIPTEIQVTKAVASRRPDIRPLEAALNCANPYAVYRPQ